MRVTKRPRARPLSIGIALLAAAALIAAAPLGALASDAEYRGMIDGYHEEGFGLVPTFLPFTEYRGMIDGYHEEGFGLVPTFLPFTEYRGMIDGYHEEGFGLL